MLVSDKIVNLSPDRPIWAVGAIHGDAGRLRALHEMLGERVEAGDQLIYLGNFLGVGSAIHETVQELLLFRRRFLARPRACTPDIIYLRGGQEEMWQKLLQIHLALNPAEVLMWMFNQGAAATLTAYGGETETGLGAVRDGATALNRWASGVRDRIRAADGHNALMASLRRAAATTSDGLLFVNSGLDPSVSLEEQNDNFWWGAPAFEKIDGPYRQYRKLIRGYDPNHRGVRSGSYTMTLDGGCGFGGSLVAVRLDPQGNQLEQLEA